MENLSNLIDDQSALLIHEFCQKVCFKINESKETKEEIYEELKSNMEEEVIELVKNNFTSAEATKMVLQGYHSPQKMVNKLSEIYKTKKWLNGKLLKLAAFCLIFSIIFISTFYYWNFKYIKLQAEQFFDLLPDTVEFIENGVSLETEEMIKYGVDNFLSVQAAMISIVEYEDAYNFNGEYQYIYNSKERNRLFEKEREHIFDFPFYGISKRIPNSDIIVEAQIKLIQLSNNILYFGIFLFACYWFLFSTWAVSNLKYNHVNKLQLAVVIVLLFNIVGYLFYVKRNVASL